MNAVFADTFFYLALLDEHDPAHTDALDQSKVNRTIVTTEFILLELGNACARAEDHADFLALLAGIRASSRTRVVPLDSHLLQRGLDLFAERQDKNWSLTGGYAYQKYDFSDDQFNGYTNTIPFPGVTTNASQSYLNGWNANQAYNANIFYLLATFKY